jgi:hypothetical protein
MLNDDPILTRGNMAFQPTSAHGRANPWFPSKRDTWLMLLVWGAQAAILWSAYQTAIDPDASLATKVLTVSLLGATFAFVLWVVYGTRYGFTRRKLLVRSGPFRWTVPLRSIDSVRPSRNPLSSPAASLDRLEVRYAERRKRILISPEDKAGFLRALVARAPHLEVVGDAAERRDEDL